jgi:large subunit ribosomal protein L30
MSKKLRVTLVKSPIGYNKRQKATVQALGLGKMNSSAIHEDTPPVRGMIHKIIHLLKVEEIES